MTKNKSDLIDRMSEAADISKASAESALNAFITSVMGTVADGGKVTIPGFGSWEPTQRAARTGRNPQTGETIQIKASTLPKFKAGKSFKDAVNTNAQNN